MYFNLDGKETKRTPINNPYSYEPFVQWLGDYHKERSHSVYSDRMYRWDTKKYNNCCEEIFGDHSQYFDNKDPKKVNQFLNKYFGKEIKLTAIMQCCNGNSGFPYWRFIYEEDT